MDKNVKKFRNNLFMCIFNAIVYCVGAHYLIQGYGGAKILGYIQMGLGVISCLLCVAYIMLIIAMKYAEREGVKNRATLDISKDANLNETLNKQDDKKEDI